MLFSVGSRLPEYRVKALNNEPASANLLHNEEYARRCGFGGCVVPGVLVYAYMSRSLVDFFGEPWLARGTAEVRMEHPIYDGEEVRVGGNVSEISASGTISVCCTAVNAQGIDCGTATATLPCQPAAPEPRLEDYPAGERTIRRAISLETLEAGEPLTPIRSEVTRNTHWEYCQKQIKDHHPLYQHALHPGVARVTGRPSSGSQLRPAALAFHRQFRQEVSLTAGGVRGRNSRARSRLL